MTSGDLQALARLNARINAEIKPVADHRDEWRLGVLAGDCEEYVLAKRAALLAAGWTPSQALIAVTDDPWTGPHAVLIVRTDRGDFVLDNLTDQIRRWDESGASFVARQSARLPAMWVRL